MGERKVLNKYYPPDFDPSLIPRRRQPKNQQMKVRMMLPMSIRCNTCGTYIYKGTKFNSRKEDAVGETYLGIQIFRFYFKCTKCSAEISYKTDPKNSDYVVESGASRNFEPWRDEDEANENAKKKRLAEEMGDAMKSLENKAIDSKQDMDILAALEEMRSMKSRHATVSLDLVLETLLRRTAAEKEEKTSEELDEADEALIKSINFQNSKDFVRRIEDDEDDDFDEEFEHPSSSLSEASDSNKKGKSTLEPPKFENPTDLLTKETISSRPKDGGGVRSKAALIMPKFIPKPRSDEGPSKKARITPAESNSSTVKAENESKQMDVETGKAENGSKQTDVEANALQSLFQNYDSDDE